MSLQNFANVPPLIGDKKSEILHRIGLDFLSDANWIVKDNQFNQYRVLQQPTSEEIKFFKSNLNLLINEIKSKGRQARGDWQQLQSLEDLSDLSCCAFKLH